MNKKLLWTIVGVIVVVLIIIFIVKPGQTVETGDDQVQGTSNQTASEQSLKEIMASNKPVKCDYTDTQSDGSTVQGTSYIASGKMRGDFSSTVNGKTTSGHMIMADNTSYTWIDGMSTGFKVSLSALSTTTTGQSSSSQQGIDPEKKVDYKCSSWTPDNSQFTLPSGITFTDFSAILKTQTSGKATTGSGSTGASGSQCAAACASAPAAYQAQCMASCNQVHNKWAGTALQQGSEWFLGLDLIDKLSIICYFTRRNCAQNIENSTLQKKEMK